MSLSRGNDPEMMTDPILGGLEAIGWTRTAAVQALDKFIAAERERGRAEGAASVSAAVEAVHQPQDRCHNGSGEWSVTPAVWESDYREDYGDPTVFTVCSHCGGIELHESRDSELIDVGQEHDYLDALWPCATIRASTTDAARTHDAAVRAEAWREGFNRGVFEATHEGQVRAALNPYEQRADAEEQS